MSTKFLSFHPASELFLKAGQLALVFYLGLSLWWKKKAGVIFLIICVEDECIVRNVGILPYIRYSS